MNNKYSSRLQAVRNEMAKLNIDAFIVPHEDEYLLEEVVDCMKVNGGIDYIVFMMSSSIEDFNSVCNDMMQDTLGIEKIISHFVIDTAKWFGGYPLDTLEWKVQED